MHTFLQRFDISVTNNVGVTVLLYFVMADDGHYC